MKYLAGLLAGFLFGAAATAIVTRIAYPNPSNNGFSLGPLLIYILPVCSACISVPVYIISMLMKSTHPLVPDEKRHPASGAVISGTVTFIASIVFWALFWNKR